jgi:hypothetical protein
MARRPIFQGADHLDQIKKIFSVIGTPVEEDLVWLPPAPCPARAFIARMPAHAKKPWSTVLPKISEAAINALDAMICVNPYQRASAKDAMLLDYFQPLFMEGDAKQAEVPITCDIDRMDLLGPSKQYLQHSMYAEICHLHPEHAMARVVELRLLPAAEDGTLAVSCHGVGGDVLATITAEPGQDIGDLRAKLSRQLEEPLEVLQLLRADGRLLNRCDAEEHQEARLVLAA